MSASAFQNILRFTAGFAAAVFIAASAQAADAHKGVDPTIAELQRALDTAARQAKAGDSLDSAYELLTLADTAQQFKATQIASGAGSAVADLIRRATADALKHPKGGARDTLDQFVDLRSEAYSAPAAQDALDEGLRALFPAVAGSIEHDVAAANVWEDKLTTAGDLAQLQASAVQVKMDQVAHDIGAAFDTEIAGLRKTNDTESDADVRQRHTAALADALKVRTDRLNDAKANNIDVLANRMRGAPADAPGARTDPKD